MIAPDSIPRTEPYPREAVAQSPLFHRRGRLLLTSLVALAGCGPQFVHGDYGLSGADSGRYTQVVTAPLFGCALREDGEATCWGHRQSRVLEPVTGAFVQLAASEYGVCGLRTDHGVACWGRRFDGPPLADPPGRYTSITGGRTGFCGLLTEGGVWCWGATALGFVPGAVSYRSVHLGTDNVCVLREDGRVECAGADVPGPMTPPEDEMIAIDMGWALACGVRSDGSAVCWGHGEDEDTWGARRPIGDLAAGAADDLEFVTARSALDQAERARQRAEITKVGMDRVYAHAASLAAGLVAVGLPKAIGAAAIRKGGVLASVDGTNLRDISVGALGEICGLDRAGVVTCWGSLAPDRYGRHGPVEPAPGSYLQIDAGSVHACGIRDDGRIACWGGGFREVAAPPGSPAAQ